MKALRRFALLLAALLALPWAALAEDEYWDAYDRPVVCCENRTGCEVLQMVMMGSFAALQPTDSLTVRVMSAALPALCDVTDADFSHFCEEFSVDEGTVRLERAADGKGWDWLREDGTRTPLRGDVRFDHVRFGYTPEKTVIHDFSCTVQPGQKVAIVGPTGAGKTTMVKLLMRFYDVDAGSITLNGHNVRDFDRSALREGFGMVLQDTWLFKGTIMENIRYGRLDATDEEVIAAAKAANADHFIRTLPGGYQMELNEDASNVSQGQKQLLTIARTILADNRILILDEATSSVDTRTEQRIQTAMDRLMEGRTSFVIAHRLSTIRDADLILVMRDGDIVEQGTHDQLIEAGGFYADLYNSQFEDVVA